MYDARKNLAGSIRVKFSSTPKYTINNCMREESEENFQTSLPSESEKVWRFTLFKAPEYRLLVHCNEVEVLNFVMSNESCVRDWWSRTWGRDVAKMKFHYSTLYTDNASHYFRLLHPGNLINSKANSRTYIQLISNRPSPDEVCL